MNYTKEIDSKLEYGVIGLRPDATDKTFKFVHELYDNSQDVDLNVFTTRMVSGYFESYIEFGENPDTWGSAIYGEDTYEWAELSNDPTRWMCILISSEISKTLTGKGVVFDTTS